MELDLEKINDSDHLLDILIGVENVLDSIDAYCYVNWIEGTVIEGPIVSRYWVKVSLLYPYDKMPDPRAALRLLKHGVQVEFDRMQRAAVKPSPSGEPVAEDKPPEWIVKLSVPRSLLDQNEEADLKMYDDEINPDDVESAKDSGIDDESTLHTDEQLPDGNGPPPDQDAPPPRPPAAG